MNSLILKLTLSLLLLTCQDDPPYDVIIRNITVIDPANRESIPEQTIFIRDGIIIKVDNSKNKRSESKGVLEIDGTGKFVSAGYWNMHSHICWHPELDEVLFPVLFSYGITGVRDMGGDAAILNTFKKRIEENPFHGPVLYGPGPLIDGPNPVHPDFSVALTNENYRTGLDSLYDLGVDFLKIYSLLPEELVMRIAAFSAEKGIPFVGHISEYMTATQAAELRMKSFEHLNRIEDLAEDPDEMDSFIKEVKSNNSWVCPTLIIYKRKVDISQGMEIKHPLDSFVNIYLRGEWNAFKERRRASGSDPEYLREMETAYDLQKAIVRKFYDEGVQLLVGSDFGGMPYIYPGYGLHKEMELLQELDIDTYDILRMVTYNPAKYFEITDHYGSVGSNKVADLVILNSDPVLDIRNAMDIDKVFKSGHLVSVSN